MLNERRALDNSAHGRSGSLSDVLLNVVDDVLVYFTVDNWLDLNNAVLSDCLLNDGCTALTLIHDVNPYEMHEMKKR